MFRLDLTLNIRFKGCRTDEIEIFLERKPFERSSNVFFPKSLLKMYLLVIFVNSIGSQGIPKIPRLFAW